ncbi:MAG: hypothetical protein U0996_16150 [Planctomycetaceae bacterium]
MSDSTLSHVPMEMAHSTVKWLARLTSVASVGLLSMFLFGGNEGIVPTLREAVAMAFFPFGVAAGMIIGWKREFLGGVVSILSLAMFYVIMAMTDPGESLGPWFLIFTVPGFLFLFAGLLQKRQV